MTRSHLRPLVALLALGAASACRRPRRAGRVVRAIDRAIERVTGARPSNALAPVEDRRATECGRSLDVTPAGPAGGARIVFDGHVVDLGTHAVVGAIVPGAADLDDGDTAFRHCGDDTLRAYSLATGRMLWSAPTIPRCGPLLHGARVYCLAANAMSAHDRADGRAATLFESTGPRIESAKVLSDTLAALLDDGVLRFVRLRDGATLREVPPPAATRDAPRTSLFVAKAADLACLRRQYPDHDALECFDGRGVSRWARDVPTTQDVRRYGQDVRERTLSFDRVGRAHLLYTTWWGPSTRTMVIALTSGTVVADLPVRAAGLLEGPDGALAGVLTLPVETTGDRRDVSLALLAPGTGAERFRTRVDFDGDTTAALLQGDQLDVAVYDRMAMTAAVYALDARTGALRWRYHTGAVVQGHSEYSNAVALEAVGGDLLVRGDEAGGSYLVALDPATGARRMTVLPRHCASEDYCMGW